MSDGSAKRTREQQRQETRKSILKAARKTMKKHGLEKTTIREISREASVATGSVMAHFGSKESLLFEVFHQDIQTIADEVFEAINPKWKLPKSLIFVGESFLDRYAADGNMNADFLEHALFASGQWGNRFTQQAEEAGKRMAPMFVRAIERGEIDLPANEVPAAIGTFFANYYFVLINQIKTRFAKVEEGKRMFRTLVNHHCRGLSK